MTVTYLIRCNFTIVKALGRYILLVGLLAAGISPLMSQTCRVLLDEEATQEESFYDCFGGSNMHLNVVLDDRSDPVKLRLLDRNYRLLDEDFEGLSIETDHREGTYYIEARLDSSRANCTFQNRLVARDTIRYEHVQINPDDLTLDDIEIIEVSDCGETDGEIRVTDWPGIEYRVSEVSSVWRSSGVFRNLAGGSYRLTIRDQRTRCESNRITLEILEPSPMLSDDQIETVDPSACGVEDGSINITLPAGVEINFQNLGWNTASTYEDLAAGNYTFTLRNPQVPDCVSNEYEIILEEASAPNLQPNQITTTDESVCQAADGSIVIDHPLENIEYSIDGQWTSDPIFDNLSPGFYEVRVRSNPSTNCQSNGVQVEIKAAQVPLLRRNDITVRAETQCGRADGGILVANKGSAIEYGIDGVFGSVRMFPNLTPGTYQIAIRPIAAPECLSTVFDVIVEASGAPNLAASEVIVTNEQNCGGNDGSILVQSELSDIEYGLDGSFGPDANFADLPPGFYDVQIRAAGEATCVSLAQTVFVDSVAKPLILPSDFQVTQIQQCGQSDGAITYVGQTPNLEFSIDGGDFIPAGVYSDLSAGAYTLVGRIIGSDDCTTNEVNFELVEPGAPNLDDNAIETADPTDCGTQDGLITIGGFNEDFSASIDGGTTFTQQLSFDNLAAGFYEVVVQDPNGCRSTAVEVTLEAVGSPVLTLDDFDFFAESSCGALDGSISLLATDFEFQIEGVTDFTQDLFDLPAGNYDVEYRRIDVPECSNVIPIEIGFSQADIVFKFPGSLNMLVYPDSTLEYVWGTLQNGNFSELPPAKNDRQYYLLEEAYDPSETYAVMVFCGDQSDLVLFDGPAITETPSLQIFPNPTHDVLTVEGVEEDADYRIFDSLGKLCLSGTLQAGIQSDIVDVGRLEEGHFRLVIISATSNTVTSTLFIKI